VPFVHARAALVGAVLAAAVAAFAPVAAQDAAYPAALYAGECGNLAEEVAALEPAVAPGGSVVGAPGAVPVAESRSALPVSPGDAVGLRLVLAITDPADPGTVLACGTVGGVFDSADSLAVALSPVGGSGVFGIAHFDPTGVTLFVAGPAAGGAAGIGRATLVGGTEATPTA
jgi:hypothetical protein